MDILKYRRRIIVIKKKKKKLLGSWKRPMEILLNVTKEKGFYLSYFIIMVL